MEIEPSHRPPYLDEVNLTDYRLFRLLGSRQKFKLGQTSGTLPQGISKAYRFTLTMPACRRVCATGLVDPSTSGSNSPSAGQVNPPLAAPRRQGPPPLLSFRTGPGRRHPPHRPRHLR